MPLVGVSDGLLVHLAGSPLTDRTDDWGHPSWIPANIAAAAVEAGHLMADDGDDGQAWQPRLAVTLVSRRRGLDWVTRP